MASGGARLALWDSPPDANRDSYSALRASELRATEQHEQKQVWQSSGGARSAFFDEKPIPNSLQKNLDIDPPGRGSLNLFSMLCLCLEDLLPLRCYACSVVVYLCGLWYVLHFVDSEYYQKLYCVIGLVLGAFPCFSFCLKRCLAARVKRGLHNMVGYLLGAAVETSMVSVNLCAGSVSVDGLILRNPATGAAWRSEHLLCADRIGFDIHWLSLLRSCFKVIEVQWLEMEGVELVVEQAGRSSNVGIVLENLSRLLRREDENHKGPQFILHRVEIQDIALRIPNALSGCGAEASVAMADIMFEDFAQEVREEEGDVALELLLRTVLKTMASNVLGIDTLRSFVGYKMRTQR
eukprot:TRINITY_DN12586_c1_g1_i1.p1 TRINITY_DN12586_c1_g1~~TRINITY_DN12586_c1_g1_i1.p1  ORF type:complete len:351 (+),score=45.02 TRINITY_DN12586_c1_g1_i1:32-1084(+)